MTAAFRALLAIVLVMIPSIGFAEDQFDVLVIATPSKYHYEYIPVARDGIEHSQSCMRFTSSGPATLRRSTATSATTRR